ncbi:hypothetical protein [Afipia sp. 1NLS2]|uniref:hypothetical protein n=1 Tax=Afipia sp. 1NLS2 TaxID=666684 RepID=UPI0001D9FD67|nr:hypothetical protein [Afipia sp. 1NLS2]EFI53119.1 chromatin structure-remodeling complex protein RSC7 [Afipia sp. 1NLS2]
MDVDQVFRSRSKRATDSPSLITPSQPDAGHGPQRSAGRASEIEEIRLQGRMGAHQNGDTIDAPIYLQVDGAAWSAPQLGSRSHVPSVLLLGRSAGSGGKPTALEALRAGIMHVSDVYIDVRNMYMDASTPYVDGAT